MQEMRWRFIRSSCTIPLPSQAEALYRERHLQGAQLDAFQRRVSYTLDPIAYDMSFATRRYVEEYAYGEQISASFDAAKSPLAPPPLDHLYREIVYRGSGDRLPYDHTFGFRSRLRWMMML
jgi:hypothetical protein